MAEAWEKNELLSMSAKSGLDSPGVELNLEMPTDIRLLQMF